MEKRCCEYEFLISEGVNPKPFEKTLSVIGGKWKMRILFWVYKADVMRYGELKKAIKTVSHKVLTDQLRELENDGLLTRTVYNEMPPKVEYSLTAKALTLMPILSDFCDWGEANF